MEECYFGSLHSDVWCCMCKYHSETFVRRWLLLNAVRHACWLLSNTFHCYHRVKYSHVIVQCPVPVVCYLCYWIQIAFLFPNWTFYSDHDQWTWLRERKLQKLEDSEGEVSCLSETEWYFYCSSGYKWIREVIKGLQFILCVPLWEWIDLHINKAKVVE